MTFTPLQEDRLRSMTPDKANKYLNIEAKMRWVEIHKGYRLEGTTIVKNKQQWKQQQ